MCGPITTTTPTTADLYNLEPATDYTGGRERRRLSRVSLEDCRQACLDDAAAEDACNGFVYNTRNTNCYLKHFNRVPEGTPDPDFISGLFSDFAAAASTDAPTPALPTDAPLSTSCYNYYPDSDIEKGRGPRLNFDTEQECIDECNVLADSCEVFAYNTANGNCYLKAYKRSPPSPVSKPGWNAGQKRGCDDPATGSSAAIAGMSAGSVAMVVGAVVAAVALVAGVTLRRRTGTPAVGLEYEDEMAAATTEV